MTPKMTLTMTFVLLAGLVLAATSVMAGLGPGGTPGFPTTQQMTRDALTQARAAIVEGDAGRPASLAAHAWQALGVTTWAAADLQTAEAARHLEEALSAARAGDTAEATEHAREAERVLERRAS